ncbi:MAG: aspartate dehydrogenase [Eubacteriales bacterium]|nr:aspartate dehydrogenase [Eubacteriales bacterium]
MFRKKKAQNILEYDSVRLRPVVKSSICTGEKVAGFVDKESGKFEDIMLIRGEEEFLEFCRMYGLCKDEVGKIW